MSKVVRVKVDDKWQWPNRCPKCGTKKDLVLTETRISCNGKRLPGALGTNRRVGTNFILAYPVCKGHKTLTGFTNFFTRGGQAGTLLRFILYLFAFTTVAGVLADSLRNRKSPDFNVAHWEPIGWVGFITIALAVVTAFSSFWAPLRLKRLDEGVVDLGFSYDAYADAFAKLNPVQTHPDNAWRKPWYDKKYWLPNAAMAAISYLALRLFFGESRWLGFVTFLWFIVPIGLIIAAFVAAKTNKAEAVPADWPYDDATPIDGVPSLGSVNGFGFTLYGKSDLEPINNSYMTTHYFICLFVPVFPVGRYRVVDEGSNVYNFLGKGKLRAFDKIHLAIVAGLIALLFFKG
jgi:hypothetical protein